MDLDKVMARWVGLKYESDGACCPRDNEYFYFTKSLDACFKWLVPKLEGYRISITRTTFVVAPAWTVEVYNSERDGVSKGEDPALALCLAIKKLIGGQDE